MRTALLIVVATVLLAAGRGAPAADFPPIPGDVQLADARSTADVRADIRSALKWPSPEEMAAKTVWELEEAGLVPNQGVWEAHQILQAQWLPGDFGSRLIPLRDYPASGMDAWVCRWDAGKYLLQVACQRTGMIVLVTSKDAQPSTDDTAREALFQSVVADVMQHASEILSMPYRVFRTYARSAAMIQDVEAIPPQEGERLDYWYGSLKWWTDGRTVLFSVPHRFGEAEVDTETRIFSTPSTAKVPVMVGPKAYATIALGVSADRKVLCGPIEPLQALGWKITDKRGILVGRKGTRTFRLSVGSKVAVVDGRQVALPIACKKASNRWMLPISFLTKSLGLEADWTATAIVLKEPEARAAG